MKQLPNQQKQYRYSNEYKQQIAMTLLNTLRYYQSQQLIPGNINIDSEAECLLKEYDIDTLSGMLQSGPIPIRLWCPTPYTAVECVLLFNYFT